MPSKEVFEQTNKCTKKHDLVKISILGLGKEIITHSGLLFLDTYFFPKALDFILK